MSAPDPTQLPPVGQALPAQAAPAQAENETTQASWVPPVAEQAVPEQAEPATPDVQLQGTSVEKVNQAIQAAMATQAAHVAVFLGPLLAKLKLPQDPAELDAVLERSAKLLLTLRSDGLAALDIVEHAL